MNWIALYDTYIVLSGRWKYCEEYIGSKVIEYGFKMSEVARRKIVFELKKSAELGRTVDCSVFTCQEMRLDPSTRWFDYKSHSCGLKYEFCLATHESQVGGFNTVKCFEPFAFPPIVVSLLAIKIEPSVHQASRKNLCRRCRRNLMEDGGILWNRNVDDRG